MIRVLIFVGEEVCYEFTACQYSIDRRRKLLSTRMNHLASTMELHYEEITVWTDNRLEIRVTASEEEYSAYDSRRTR